MKEKIEQPVPMSIPADRICGEALRRLTELSDEPYRKFQKGLVPGNDTIIGVRVPKVRTLAKEIAKKSLALPGEGEMERASWPQYMEACFNCCLSYEERMLLGFVICYAKMDFEKRLSYVSRFIPLIDNWAVCDIFCGSLKPAPEQLPILWEFLQPYLALGTADSAPAAAASEPAAATASDRIPVAAVSDPAAEFPIRFAVVILLSYYIKEDYIGRILALLDSIRHDGYYVRMAVAWAVSMCFVRFPEQTGALLRNNHMDDFTHNKSIQKIIESLQVDKETKAMLRQLKRKPRR